MIFQVILRSLVLEILLISICAADIQEGVVGVVRLYRYESYGSIFGE